MSLIFRKNIACWSILATTSALSLAPTAAKAACTFPLAIAIGETCTGPLATTAAAATNTNAGTISATGSDSGLYLNHLLNSLTNSGTIQSQDAPAINIQPGGSITSFTNTSSGAITSTNASAIALLSGPIVTFENSGTISSSANGLSIYSYITTLNNYGSISGGGSGYVGIVISNAGNPSNSATITTLNNFSGGSIDHINLSNGAQIGTINNHPGASIGRIYITNVANGITNFSNAQGGNGSSAATTALPYFGTLPTNYFIHVVSSTNYGQLDVYNLPGQTRVGIAAGSTLTRGSTYASVFTGMTASNFTNTSGTYGSYSWILNNSSGTTWDLVILNTSSVNTTTALSANANGLRGVMDRRLSGLAEMTNYDCSSFDKHGVCLSFQARYSNFDNMNEGAGVLTAAYRLSDNFRLGAFIDYRSSEREPTGIKLSNDLPTFGAFFSYSQHRNGIGLQGKVLAAVQKGDATLTRDNSLEGTEPGSGTARLNSTLVYGELGWGFAISPSMLATPYIGLRHTDATRGSYNETSIAGTVDFALSYNDYSQRLTTAIAGLRLAGMLSENIGYQIGAGLEHDLHQQTSAYSGTSSMVNLTSFALAVDGVSNRTRGVGSVGMFYQLEKNQRITGNFSIRNQAYTSQAAVNVMGGYQVAF